MWNRKCDTVNICTSRTHRYRGQTCQGGGGTAGQRIGSWGLADANYYMTIQDG